MRRYCGLILVQTDRKLVMSIARNAARAVSVEIMRSYACNCHIHTFVMPAFTLRQEGILKRCQKAHHHEQESGCADSRGATFTPPRDRRPHKANPYWRFTS